MIDPNSNEPKKVEAQKQEPEQKTSKDLVAEEEHQAVSSKPASTASKKRDPIESLDGLLRVIYSGKHNRVALKKNEIVAMRQTAESGLVNLDESLALARVDRTLGRTLDLLFICAEQFNLPLLEMQTYQFVQGSLIQHPAFAAAKLLGVLTGDNESLTDSDAVKALSKVDFMKLDWQVNGEPLKKTEANLCRMNSIACLLMFLKEKDEGLTPDRIQRLLEAYLWRPAALPQKKELEKLKILMYSKEPVALAIARENLTRELNQTYKQKEDAVAGGEKMAARAKALAIELDEKSKQVASVRSENKKLKRVSQELEQKNGDDLVHHQYDYKILKDRVQRCLEQELELLGLGLSALRRDPPKVHVMEDHAERAIDGLKTELGRILDNE